MGFWSKVTLKHISNFVLIFGAVATIWKAAVFFEKFYAKVNNIEAKIDTADVKDSKRDLKLNEVTLNQSGIIASQAVINEKIKSNIGIVDVINKSYSEHLKSDNKIDQLLLLNQGILDELKKNSNNIGIDTVEVSKYLDEFNIGIEKINKPKNE